MEKLRNIMAAIAMLVVCQSVFAQEQQVSSVKAGPDDATIKANAELDKKSAEWAASLQLNDKAREARVSAAIAEHLKSVRNWNNDHPHTTVPAGINPATGNRLSDLDRQVIASSAMPATVHQKLMGALKADLAPEQVELILDKYTIGKVDFTMKGYKAIVTDLTKEEEAKILEYLKQAREQAIDYKSMTQISAIFEIYKTKSEQYLNNNGRNWRQLYKAYVDKVKAEKEAAKTKQN